MSHGQGKPQNGQGNVREKSGNFVRAHGWTPWLRCSPAVNISRRFTLTSKHAVVFPSSWTSTDWPTHVWRINDFSLWASIVWQWQVQTKHSQNTLHSLPARVSYGASFENQFGEKRSLYKGFECSVREICQSSRHVWHLSDVYHAILHWIT